MRIIAGQFKGRAIEAPAGGKTRPTTDRMRESLMSRIASALGGFEGLSVLDAFAGSGALGLEALSRGARHCLFCERDRAALQCLRANLASLRVETSRFEVRAGDVFKTALRNTDDSFDLVFFDPPYDSDRARLATLLTQLVSGRFLAEGALISYEYRRGEDAEADEALGAAGLEVVSVRDLSQSSIALARLL